MDFEEYQHASQENERRHARSMQWGNILRVVSFLLALVALAVAFGHLPHVRIE